MGKRKDRASKKKEEDSSSDSVRLLPFAHVRVLMVKRTKNCSMWISNSSTLSQRWTFKA